MQFMVKEAHKSILSTVSNNWMKVHCNDCNNIKPFQGNVRVFETGGCLVLELRIGL